MRVCDLFSQEGRKWDIANMNLFSVKSGYHVGLRVLGREPVWDIKGKETAELLVVLAWQIMESSGGVGDGRLGNAGNLRAPAVGRVSSFVDATQQRPTRQGFRTSSTNPQLDLVANGWNCFVDGSIFVAQDLVGYGIVVEDEEGRFIRGQSSYDEGPNDPQISEALAM
ncbi:hypothetical protein JCGZ_26793 [Jatropha curcas]|uniref:Uncharacterized protein n=1 Tax=Jatropha curcas TaxID=180498 RepID=A0A067LBB5_JATCU|nr:hypothetical protein JCGZ_26793 [Jatropha curcas]